MKQFTIVFDEKQEEYATILNTLVSEEARVKNIEVSLEYYQKNCRLTDKDCVLFVGEESSRKYMNNFRDKYSKYGIHLGYRGCKAWIYCEKFNWNKRSYKMFHDELMDLYKRLDMNPAKVKDYVAEGVKEYCKSGTTVAPADATSPQRILWTSVVGSQIMVQPNMILLLIYMKIKEWIKSLRSESMRIDQQYKFATVLFFSDYLKDYLNLIDVENAGEKENRQ